MAEIHRPLRFFGCMDYAAGGLTCPGVFLIPTLLKVYIRITHRLSIFFSWSVLRVLKHATIATPFYFSSFFLFCVPCTN
jgi:hypothetical protein